MSSPGGGRQLKFVRRVGWFGLSTCPEDGVVIDPPGHITRMDICPESGVVPQKTLSGGWGGLKNSASHPPLGKIFGTALREKSQTLFLARSLN